MGEIWEMCYPPASLRIERATVRRARMVNDMLTLARALGRQRSLRLPEGRRPARLPAGAGYVAAARRRVSG
jgi:hypothetical protein